MGEEALAIAVYAMLVTDDLPEALRIAVNHSGDSDSTGSVCGNLAGAWHGVAAIPAEWLEQLELRPAITALTGDALAEFGSNPPVDDAWLQRYPGW